MLYSCPLQVVTLQLDRRTQDFGFTLLELLIVIMLTALLALMSLFVGFHWFSLQKQQMMLTTLRQSLDFARQAAIAQGQSVTLCAAASAQICGDDWSRGILIFIDAEKTAIPHTDSLLLQVPPLLQTGKLVWRGWLPVNIIRFAADGLPHGYHGSFYLLQDHSEKIVLVMNALGRIRMNGLVGQ